MDLRLPDKLVKQIIIFSELQFRKYFNKTIGNDDDDDDDVSLVFNNNYLNERCVYARYTYNVIF